MISVFNISELTKINCYELAFLISFPLSHQTAEITGIQMDLYLLWVHKTKLV